MLYKTFLKYLLLLIFLSTNVNFVFAQIGADVAKAVGYDKELEKIDKIFIYTSVESDLNTISEQSLYKFIKNRIESKIDNDIEFLPLREFTAKGRGEDTPIGGWERKDIDSSQAVMGFWVWAVNDNYPIAISMGYDFHLSPQVNLRNDKTLGITSPVNYEETVIENISDFIDDFSLFFNKVTSN